MRAIPCRSKHSAHCCKALARQRFPRDADRHRNGATIQYTLPPGWLVTAVTAFGYCCWLANWRVRLTERRMGREAPQNRARLTSHRESLRDLGRDRPAGCRMSYLGPALPMTHQAFWGFPAGHRYAYCVPRRRQGGQRFGDPRLHLARYTPRHNWWSTEGAEPADPAGDHVWRFQWSELAPRLERKASG
jgi:hypothetical protein